MSKAIILDGKMLADKILLDVRSKILETGITPGLAAILIGRNPASEMYVRLKEKAAEKVGIIFSKYLADNEIYADIDEYELGETIKFLNNDPQIDGILLQLPLPEGFDQDKVVKLIDPKKDADGFNNKDIIPPTIAAIIELLKATEEKLSDKKTLILGKSEIFTVGIETNLKNYLKIKNLKITNSIPADCNTYDIVIIALGQAHILKKPNIKKGAIIIDIGINKLDGVTVGDADPSVENNAAYVTPVPGGVGPLTIACLLRNVFELAQKNRPR